MLLAIDTSTALTGLACYNSDGLIAECVWQSGRNHTAQLLPQLDLLLDHIGADRTSLEAVAVALGPGSWSGLRVGMSVAKGIALAGDLVLLGINTLDVLAYQHQHATLPVYPLIRLGRERFATALFQQDTTWQRQGSYRNVSLDELCGELTTPVQLCGDIDADTKAHLIHCLGALAQFPTQAANMRRPGYLAELAWQRFAAGAHDDLATLEPFYLGEPVKPKR